VLLHISPEDESTAVLRNVVLCYKLEPWTENEEVCFTFSNMRCDPTAGEQSRVTGKPSSKNLHFHRHEILKKNK
jgi:hypothetical protein